MFHVEGIDDVVNVFGLGEEEGAVRLAFESNTKSILSVDFVTDLETFAESFQGAFDVRVVGAGDEEVVNI